MLSKSTPILIAGFGSIGKRHYRNLMALGYTNIAVFDPLDSAFDGQAVIGRIEKLDIATAKKFKVAFICTPNNLHIKHAGFCAKAGCDLFIEKPLSHNLNGVRALANECKRKKLITMVGCNMRFHPGPAFIKKYLDSGKLGKIYSIRHEFGYFLPYWRPHQDYRKNYAAKKSTGGGIILDDIHEFDLLFWLNGFSPVQKRALISDKVGGLSIQTEDMCIAAYQFKNKVIGSVACDYLQQSYSRKCRVIGEKGSLNWDMNQNAVWLETKNNTRKLVEFKKADNNSMYLKEVSEFLSCINTRKASQNPIAFATMTLENILS